MLGGEIVMLISSRLISAYLANGDAHFPHSSDATPVMRDK